MNDLLISPDTVSIVHLVQEDRWVRLTLWLAREFTGGELVAFAPEATVSLDGIDEVSASYRRANWVSGVASGALYAFRSLALPRQHLILTDLSGRLRASDMSALATCSALAVARLAGKAIPNLPLDGWTIQTQVAERGAVPSRTDQSQQPLARATEVERVAAELNRLPPGNPSAAEQEEQTKASDVS